KSLGGGAEDKAWSVVQTTDGGFVIAGSSLSNNGDITIPHGDYDYWIVKLDANGNLVWQKSLGGSGDDQAFSIQQTTDGGFIIAGVSYSQDGDVSGNHGSGDYWIAKTDIAANILWEKSFGGTSTDVGYSVQQTIDGGFLVAGSTISNDGDVSQTHGGVDCWVLKLDTSGNLEWQKSLGGSNE